METNSREIDCKAAMELDASLDSLDQLRHVCMAWIEARSGVDDANERPCQCVLAISRGFDEYFPQEEGEVGIAITDSRKSSSRSVVSVLVSWTEHGIV